MIHIIGAGPSGISIAYYFYLAGVKEICIYERTDSIGGLARSWNHEDFILDTGPHIFHTSDNEISNDWNEVASDLFIKGQFNSCNILDNFPNTLFHYPLSIETLRHNLDYKRFQEIKNELNNLSKFDSSRSAKTFREFMEGKVGKKLTEMFFTSYPRKVWGIDTNEMLADWAPQRIQLREKNEPFYKKPFVAVGAKGTGCFYQRIIEILRKDDKFKLLTKKNLTDIKVECNNIKELIFNKSERIKIKEKDHIISTIPATNFARFFDLHLNLGFRGVRSQYLFFKNEKILPMNYNWSYCSQAKVSFNRITEPPSMTKEVAKKGYSYICVETTFPSGNKNKINQSYEEVINWLKKQKNFNSAGYIPELNTENYEHFVYPIQDKTFRTSLAEYNSLTSSFNNLSVMGTSGEFHYSDMQIIFRKSKIFVEGYLNKLNKDKSNSIPLIKNFRKEKKDFQINNQYTKMSYLHQLSNVDIPLIAEIGINHNGDIELAKKMMLEAKNSGANFAKFQYYSNESRVEKNNHTEFLHETADGTEMSLNDILERSKLSNRDCCNLINFGTQIDLPVFFTVFDIDSATYMKSINQKIIKVASMDANNLPLHKKINSLGFKSIIISSGMTDYEELKRSLSVYDSNQEILIMSCRSTYPARLEDVDLGEIKFLKNSMPYEIGYSDHTEGKLVSLLAVSSGATFIERHFTTDKTLPGPDNKISINSQETLELSILMQQVSSSIKNKRKIIHSSEQSTFSMQKKSMRFPKKLKKGDCIHTDEMSFLAPPIGYNYFQASMPNTLLKVTKDVDKDEPVTKENVLIIEEAK